jgi:hypothetical protein
MASAQGEHIKVVRKSAFRNNAEHLAPYGRLLDSAHYTSQSHDYYEMARAGLAIGAAYGWRTLMVDSVREPHFNSGCWTNRHEIKPAAYHAWNSVQ